MNLSVIIGRLTRDPELRTLQGGQSVVNFTVAVDRDYKSKDGERQADFIPCVAWRQTAEFVSRYFGQGKPIIVQGTLQSRSWQDKDGSRRSVLELVVDRAEFLPGAPKDAVCSVCQQNIDDEGLGHVTLEDLDDGSTLPCDF